MKLTLRNISLNSIINSSVSENCTVSIDIIKDNGTHFNMMTFEIPYSPELSLAEIEATAVKMAKSELKSLVAGMD